MYIKNLYGNFFIGFNQQKSEVISKTTKYIDMFVAQEHILVELANLTSSETKVYSSLEKSIIKLLEIEIAQFILKQPVVQFYT